MLFNSCQFVVFFLLVTALFYALPHRLRWPMLLGASCYFYAVFVPAYLLILFLVILVDYVAGLLIEPAVGTRRRLFLGASILVNLGILGFFKYGHFAQGETHRFLAWLGYAYEPGYFQYLLPIGLSFHTFQSISYTVEVYRGRQRAERHLGLYALYVLFYPQMVAGPIERPQNVLPQLHQPIPFEGENFIRGLSWMIWGAFKKMVVADNLSLLVNPVYAAPETYHGWGLLLGTYAFAFQIYCDFSGYSDIARGAALAMGINLMKNFDVPYHARSIGEFWRRWHISLSTWFRDYVYIPLGGNRGSRLLTYRNLAVVFVLSGLWHGASWAFVIWGGLHGFYLIFGMATAAFRQRLWQGNLLRWLQPLRPLLAVFVTFHLVLVAWVFFRAGSLDSAAAVFRSLFDFSPGGASIAPILTGFQWLGLATGLIALEGIQLLRSLAGSRLEFERWPLTARGLVLATAILMILMWGRMEASDFIYFQF